MKSMKSMKKGTSKSMQNTYELSCKDQGHDSDRT
jgi:hypothetical protein